MYTLPEQEDVEWHSDRIPLSTDPNGLQDARVSQLAADQVVLEHGRLLNADVNTYKKKMSLPAWHSETALTHANDHQWKHRMFENLPSCYLASCSEQTGGYT